MIKIEKASKSYGKNEILQAIDLEISAPVLAVIKGSSGSGKTTLLNILAGFDSFTSGNLTINGTTAMIFQNYELVPQLTVAENIFLAKVKEDEKTSDLIMKLGLERLLAHYPSELSGGQKQRVGIARALLQNPDIILCDEPTESLDIENKVLVMELLKELSEEKIVIVSTHDEDLIRRYGEMVYEIKAHTLVLNESRACREHLSVRRSKTRPFQADCSYLIHKILFKRTMLSSTVFSALFALTVAIFVLAEILFAIPDSKNVLNCDKLYINMNMTIPLTVTDEEGQAQAVDAQRYAASYIQDSLGFSRAEIIVPFKSAVHEQKIYRVLIVPFAENDGYAETVSDLKGGVYVNQNCVQLMESEIGDELSLIYSLQGVEYLYQTKITGKIEESDAAWCGIYYDKDRVMSDLGQEAYNFSMTMEEAVLHYPTHFQQDYPFELIENAYKNTGMTEARLSNPLVDQRNQIKEDSKAYHGLFLAAGCLMGVMSAAFMIFYLTKEAKALYRSCSILIGSGIAEGKLKLHYLKEKLIPFCVIHLIVSQIVYRAASTAEEVLLSDRKLIAVFSIVYVLIYITITAASIFNLKKRKVNRILKEE